MITGIRKTVLCAALCAGAASGATLDLGLSAGGGRSSGFAARFGVSEVGFAGGQVAAGVSNQAVDLAYARVFALPPLGAVTAEGGLAVTWAGGVRASARVNGGLGPVALNAGAAYFTTSAAHVDPLSVWTFAPTDARPSGWTADLTARYRLGRTLVAVGGGEFGAQNMGFLGVEGRQDLTRVVPTDSEATSDPDAEPVPPEIETRGTLTWRVGARAGQGVLGVTGGVGYAAASGLSVGLDALVGAGQLGLTASLSAPDLLGEGSTLRAYVAHEPWRTASQPLRLGVESTLPLGPGTLGLDLRGGRGAFGTPGFGARLSYHLPLGSADKP